LVPEGIFRRNHTTRPLSYFTLGEAVAALGFTLAVQQLLKPIYLFRLNARFLSLSTVYALIFMGLLSVLIAAVLPSLPLPRTSPLTYPLTWEIIASILFAIPYGAVALAIVSPVRVRPRDTVRFVRASATLLSSATLEDHVEYFRDLERSLPTLITIAKFIESPGFDKRTAFYEFIHRKRIERAGYAWSLLRIVADPDFCGTLVTRGSWRLASMLQDLAEQRWQSRALEEFIEQVGRQAIIRDDSMLAREVEYHGFGAAPLLLNGLFANPALLLSYDPFGALRFGLDESFSSLMLDRFNSAAEKAFQTIIASGSIWTHSNPAYSIQRCYESIFVTTWTRRKQTDWNVPTVIEMSRGIQTATKAAQKLQRRFGHSM